MQTVISKERLVGIITENLKKHQEEYTSAIKGYYVVQADLYTALAAAARDGVDGKPEYHRKPENHENDYKRILRMLEVTEATEISLDEKDFSRYVEDNWEWREMHMQSTAAYGGKG